MPIFLERFVLPVLVTLIITVILLNPFKFDRQQQVALGLATVALAYFVAHSVYRASGRAAGTMSKASPTGIIQTGPVPTPPQAQGRTFTKKSAHELLQLYQGRTILQADGLIEPFKGQWIEVTGSVVQLIPDSSGVTAVLKSDLGDVINARFDRRWDMHLRRLSTGEKVSIRGKISDVQNGQQLYLLECEL